MKRANTLHQEAMDIAESAMRVQRAGEHKRAKELFGDAFKKEREAALLVANSNGQEPTRSVLLRSAASLGINYGDWREAERLVALALSGDPPEELQEELRDLYENVTFQRHLDLNGVSLSESEVQMSLAGGGVGYGIVSYSDYFPRMKSLENVILRTAERRQDVPFRTAGKPSKSIRDGFRLYVSVARAASFAVTIRIGSHPKQKQLFDTEPDDVVFEVAECIEAFNSEMANELKDRIGDSKYYLNFVHLMRQLAPDGDRIRAVGFTVIQAGTERRVALTHPPSPDWYLKEKRNQKTVRFSGVLTEAAKKKTSNVIGIRDNKGKVNAVHVPSALLNDIVRPLWDREVNVVAREKGKRVELVDIQPTDQDESVEIVEDDLVGSVV